MSEVKPTKPRTQQRKSQAQRAPKPALLSQGLSDRVLGPVELRASLLDNLSPEEHGVSSGRVRLSFAAIERAYASDPMVFGGVNKKASDTVKKWHRFESSDESVDEPDASVVAQLTQFARRVNLRAVLDQAMKDVVLYGDAYLEVISERDLARADMPAMGGRVLELARVVPSTILPVREKGDNADHGALKAYRQRSGGRVVDLHPSRIERLSYAALGDDQRGLGCVEAAIRAIVAKEKGDTAAGEQLSWYAKGVVEVTVSDATEEDLENTWKTVLRARQEGSNVLVGSDRHKYQIHNAAVVNPQPFNDSFYYNLASALGMPKDVLIGASAGAISGSETNLRDYYETLDAFLNIKLTPYVEALYARELGVSVEALPVRIVWNALYVNEETEAKTRFTAAQAASIAHRDRVITGNEYRWLAFGLDPLPGLDVLPKLEPMFPGFGADAAPERDPQDELRELAGDNA